MKPELISFDAAGTLIDVNWKPGRFAIECALEAGLELDCQTGEEIYSGLLQTRWRTYCEVNQTRDPAACDLFWHELTQDWLVHLSLPAEIADALSKIARERLYGPSQVAFKLFADVLPTLDILRGMGVRMVVLSNWDYSLHRIVKNLGIRDYFEHIFASLEEGPEKPDRKLFDLVASRIGVAPEGILHVGDHPLDDVEGARGAGWKSLLLDRGSSPSAGALRSLTELPERIN